MLSKSFRGKVAVNIFWEIALILDPVPEESRGACHTVTLARTHHTMSAEGLVTLPLAHM